MSYTQQPVANPGMSVGGGNRNAKNLPVDANGRDWSSGIFECVEDPITFVVAWFAPCVVYGQNRTRYEQLVQHGSPDPQQRDLLNSPNLVNNHCITHGLLHCFCAAGFVMQFLQRGPTRERYNIRGSPAEDFVLSCFCSPCELTQESREIALEEQSFGKQQA
ncbi:hypothetical protein D9613_008221 [Agrocybe pediades]|uniref:Uncharacterized protein n=1 Tax=Agrocybe pediades TaxID=84607 RepID=A0A8H4VMS9_9AGAR|nr:hypothetical protein D9613_008221 [Agrocybe pediades]